MIASGSRARLGLVAMLVATTVLSQFFRVSNGVIGPEVMRDLAMSPQALGFAGAAFFVALALMQIPVGLLFDRLGPRRTVAWLSLFTVAGALLNAAADSGGALFVARFITGVGCAASFMGAVLLASRWFSPRRYTAVLSVIFSLSMVTVLGVWAGPYLHDVYGMDPVTRGNVQLLMGAAQVLGILCYGPLDGVFDSRKKVVVPGVLLSVVCFACLALLSRPPAWLAGTLLVALCFVTSYGIVIVAHGRSLFPDHLAGRGVTTVNLAQAIGTAILPAATGMIIGAFALDASGAVSELGYRLAFAFMGALLLACLLVYLGVADSRPSRGNA